MAHTAPNSLSKGEIIALIAMMFATVALSIDAMLPALPDISTAFARDKSTDAQWVVTAFMIGMGSGTFFTGPLSDALGRKPVLLGGIALYCVATVSSYFSPSLETLVVSRFVMGLGAAAPRIVAVAVARDLFEGREMARVMSLAMMIFTLVPACAPLVGTGIILISSWRGIFVAFALFAISILLWVGLRLKEPLAPEARRSFRIPQLYAALLEMVRHPTVRISILAQTFTMAMLMITIISVQPVYDLIYDRADSFPVWFLCIALMSSSASFINSRLVVRIGMRRIASTALAAQLVISTTMFMINLAEIPAPYDFFLFAAWQATMFFVVGLTLGNLNAIAMEPMGHIAGMAASVMGGISTVLAAVLAAPVGAMLDGTILPMVGGVAVMAACALASMLWMARVEKAQ